MDCNHSLGKTIQYPDTTMACSIKQPKNTFSSSFLKSYNQKGIFSKDFTAFFHYSCCISTSSLSSHVLCFFSPEGNQIISPWSTEHPLHPLQTTPLSHSTSNWPVLGHSRGTSNFHTEFWHLPHRISQRSKCPPSSCRRGPSPAVQKLQKDLHWAILAAVSTFHPWKAVH